MPLKRSLPLRFYRALTGAAVPFVHVWLNLRRLVGKEDAARLPERFGHPSITRPPGVLVWCHAASVGEMMSCLHLLRALRTQRPDVQILLTTGTVASAKLAPQKMPEGVVHQFFPVDLPGAVARFHAHFRPDLVLWMESELWPNHLYACARANLPVVLLNARMSPRSFARWQNWPRTARALLSSFIGIYAGSEADAARYQTLHGPTHQGEVYYVGNVKYDAPALPADTGALSGLSSLLGQRPVWCAASTHPGEEAMIAEAHRIIAQTIPDVLTVLAPRHASRGGEIARLLASRSLTVARRSAYENPAAGTAIYLADTMGDLGNLYRLCEVVFVGGSLVARGGHNPIEPARLNCALLIGPHTDNFSEICAHFQSAHAIETVHSAAELGASVVRLLQDHELRAERVQAAGGVVASQAGATRAILKHLLQLLADPLEAAA
jgi:3-deoxy-D-manno-octulosonic-acid transferase